ncbi:MAG: hypothetical protein AAFN11_02355 [Chloroflexota bacterium]
MHKFESHPQMVILAHGALGWYDELVFLGIVVIFAGMMFVSWFRSRGMDYEDTDLMPQQKTKNTDDPITSDERFQLD